jgi:hypothetical protein
MARASKFDSRSSDVAGVELAELRSSATHPGPWPKNGLIPDFAAGRRTRVALGSPPPYSRWRSRVELALERARDVDLTHTSVVRRLGAASQPGIAEKGYRVALGLRIGLGGQASECLDIVNVLWPPGSAVAQVGELLLHGEHARYAHGLYRRVIEHRWLGVE